jgi:hypothetical protein
MIVIILKMLNDDGKGNLSCEGDLSYIDRTREFSDDRKFHE